MKTVYLVEDDQELAKILGLHLQKSGYQVSMFHRGDEALTALVADPPDLVVLDIMLPELDGLEILQRLRRESNTLVMMASAKGAEVDRIVGLEMGADDYLVKPLSGREMVARVKALFRRREREEAPAEWRRGRSIKVGQLALDVEKHLIFHGNERRDLTLSEYEILFRMMKAPGRTFTREELGECLDADSIHNSRAIDVHVGNLRKKVAAVGISIDPFQSVRGVGYRFKL